ncbi:thioredoxin-like protein [Ancylomarina subtilis]|uniref:Thioredoxin-like protein n=1 Tax=Ancylomarina subtilis TaxID=1639035 RepID=A0A4Q7VIZ6_9BACT|nr:(2Fe-2S) ferredoxin domain-containing protein [Ancylomarina subtilis]RZT96146.1 thioredoxin-like protein [Ancylomarina subtilis]
MSDKKDVTICLGSSCFSRGNGKTLQSVKEFFDKNNLNDLVFFHGELCTGNCSVGPILKIEDEVYKEVDAEGAIDILKKVFEEV